MTIQDWGAIGELAGGVAVIVTLIYLALQIRQNTRAIRLGTGYAVTEEFRDMFALIAGQSSLAELTLSARTGAVRNDYVRSICRMSSVTDNQKLNYPGPSADAFLNGGPLAPDRRA